MSKETSQEFYDRLNERLNDVNEYPVDYMFKFIVPNLPLSMSQIKQVIAQYELKTTTKESSTGKYVSHTAVIKANNADEIIEIYKAVGSVEKVIML